MQILVKGKIESVNKKEYEGKSHYQLQFIAKSEKGLSFLNVKTLKGSYKIGDAVEIPVKVGSFNDKLWFSEVI